MIYLIFIYLLGVILSFIWLVSICRKDLLLAILIGFVLCWGSWITVFSTFIAVLYLINKEKIQ